MDGADRRPGTAGRGCTPRWGNRSGWRSWTEPGPRRRVPRRAVGRLRPAHQPAGPPPAGAGGGRADPPGPLRGRPAAQLRPARPGRPARSPPWSSPPPRVAPGAAGGVRLHPQLGPLPARRRRVGPDQPGARPPRPAPTPPERVHPRAVRDRPAARAAAWSRPAPPTSPTSSGPTTWSSPSATTPTRSSPPCSRAPADRLHWSVPDPVPVDTDEAFETAYQQISRPHRPARPSPPASSRTRQHDPARRPPMTDTRRPPPPGRPSASTRPSR